LIQLFNMLARIHERAATHSLIKTQIISKRKYFPYCNSTTFIPCIVFRGLLAVNTVLLYY